MLAHALSPEPTARADRAQVPAPELAELRLRMSALEGRFAEPGREAEAPPLPGAPTPRKDDAPSGPSGAAPVAAPGAPSDPAPEDPLNGILGRTYGYAESESLFARLSRRRETIGDAIARLEAEIAKNPRSADLHAALATAYAAKTAFATPPGPEQGTVWAKAEQAYDEAIRLDPEHWQARYGKAFGDSMAPEFVGLRPRAIEGFEELMAIQERKPLAPEHVEVYVRLGTLLKDAGNVKKARDAWQRGLDRFPEDKRLRDALALLEEK